MVQEEKSQLSLKNGRIVLMAALAVGWVANLLFYGERIGVSLLLFAGISTLFLHLLAQAENRPPLRKNLWILLPLFFFALMGMVRANEFLTFLNVVATLGLMAFAVFFMRGGSMVNAGISSLFMLPTRVAGRATYAAAPYVWQERGSLQQGGVGRQNVMPVVRGAVLAAPILLLFTLLLASADLVFAQYIERIFEFEFLPDLGEWFGRAIFILVVSWLVAGSYVFALLRHPNVDERTWVEKLAAAIPPRFGLGFTETTTILLLVNLLFAAFVGVQFTYLFGGTQNITLEGYTYAEYARQGFGELVAVAILTLSLILGLNWISRRENKSQIKWFNGFSSTLIAFVMVLLISAWQRMALYEAMFGYTELRLYTYIGIVWMAILFVWFVATLWLKPHIMGIGFLLVGMGLLATMNLFNPDAFIVNRNMARYTTTGDVDLRYLTTLSEDGMPALVRHLPKLKYDPETLNSYSCSYRSAWDEYESNRESCDRVTRYDYMVGYFQISADESMNERNELDWPSFHLGRARAFISIEQFASES